MNFTLILNIISMFGKTQHPIDRYKTKTMITILHCPHVAIYFSSRQGYKNSIYEIFESWHMCILFLLPVVFIITDRYL